MIHDRLRHLPKYRGLDKHLGRAIDFVTSTDLASISLGRHEVAGDDVFAIVHEYLTKQPSAAEWEAHREYVDLQIIVAGVERMDVADVAELIEAEPYDRVADATFYRPPDNGQPITVSAGEFAIFLLHDAHAPTIAVDLPTVVRKVVVKIRAW